MSDIIRVGEENVEEQALSMQGAATYFQVNPLLPCDEKSTITANNRGKTAYYKAQEVASLVGSNLDKEAQNIRSLGAEFTEYDEMLAGLWESGTRYHVITAVE